jgi:integrase
VAGVPVKPEGVYSDGRGGWYFKVTLGRDPLTGRRDQITRRGFRTATEAAQARREVLRKADAGLLKPTPGALTVNGLLDLYLDGLDADGRLSAKTRFDYRHYADAYVRPVLGPRKARDVTPDVLLAWQRGLAKAGGSKNGKPLAPNTIRLARAPLAGAFKLALQTGVVGVDPVAAVPRPRAKRSIPRHWTPEQARSFLRLIEGDRTYPIWAFLLGAGVRIGELVWLRWPNVDLEERLVHVVDFASTLGYDLVPSVGKSRDAVRTIDLDDGLVRVLRAQRRLQAEERLGAEAYEDSDYVFTRAAGGPYHPQTLSTRRSSRTSTATSRRRCSGMLPTRSVPPCSPRGRRRHARSPQRRSQGPGGVSKPPGHPWPFSAFERAISNHGPERCCTQETLS